LPIVRIAIFNWRDVRNPASGGAEAFVQLLSENLLALGHSVTVFSPRFPGSSERETINGVPHVRFGGKYSAYLLAFFCYRKHVLGRFDAIIESVNGVPFFTPLFAREKVFPFIHQLTRENWFSGLALPLAFAGYHLEDRMLRAYRGLPAMVPSDSTRSDLAALGFSDVRVIREAADITPPGPSVVKEAVPTLAYLGRLTRSKRVGDALAAFESVRKEVPDARLLIAGTGPEMPRLAEKISAGGMGGCVRLLGRVDAAAKADLLRRAHLVLVPAVREGWGLVVLEANACGTPVIGYDVPGLRDSIVNGTNGFLVPDADVKSMAARAVSLLRDPPALAALSGKAALHSQGFSWKKTAESVAAFIAERAGEAPGGAQKHKTL
jgi:glycosyltransferase involved in cell wall biosynthesis